MSTEVALGWYCYVRIWYWYSRRCELQAVPELRLRVEFQLSSWLHVVSSVATEEMPNFVGVLSLPVLF